MNAYQTLTQRWHRAARANEIAGLLHWDQAVLMPPGAATARGDQLAMLALVSHEARTQADTGDLIQAAQQEDLGQWDRRNLELIERGWRKQKIMPEQLVADLSQASMAAETAWGKARDGNDFTLVQAELQRSFDLTRQRAQILSQAFGEDPYDLLMDDFEPGLTQTIVDPIFADYADFFPAFLSRVQAKQACEPAIIPLKGPFKVEDQEALGRQLVTILGFDFNRGRLDVSRHPFCGGYPGDIRMTTRYDSADFTKAMMGVLHETGHGLYESGLPQDYATQPVGQAAGLAAHESQSLLMEMQACRSDGFISFLGAKAQAHFNGQGAAWGSDNLRRLYRKVDPGLIRVDADEITYPAHVILRYELEKNLFAGNLGIADLPSAFADGVAARLGIRPQSDFEGVLQDIHWYSGGFGYFPTYTLGAMAAAQFFAAARTALSTPARSLDQDLAEGNFSRLLAWLQTHVHSRGSLTTTQDMLKAATGKTLDPSVFKAHLCQRYLGENA